MKLIRIFLFSAMLCCALGVGAKKKYPVLKFEKSTIDCGTFSQDEPEQVFKFKFTNTGNAKLVINSVRTSCGCTVADYPKEAISPGGSGVITITYNATGKLPGAWIRGITVFYNGHPSSKRIFIKGELSSMPKEDLQKRKDK